jgi:hypothetical protein
MFLIIGFFLFDASQWYEEAPLSNHSQNNAKTLAVVRLFKIAHSRQVCSGNSSNSSLPLKGLSAPSAVR